MSTGTHPLYVAIASFVLFVSPISTSRAIAEPPVTGALVDVVATQAVFLGRQALALELTPEEQARQLAGAGGNRPTLALVPGELQDGVIEVDVAAELNGKRGKGGPRVRRRRLSSRGGRTVRSRLSQGSQRDAQRPYATVAERREGDPVYSPSSASFRCLAHNRGRPIRTTSSRGCRTMASLETGNPGVSLDRHGRR